MTEPSLLSDEWCAALWGAINRQDCKTVAKMLKKVGALAPPSRDKRDLDCEQDYLNHYGHERHED